ncbi:hypothetical protein [Mycolicibacterium nivoides]|uniref:Uncharacterized protein n=1 Tax=Mycolicibacterium nivoides TaxID=2487344 RepID=A0ABW9LM74_9MYCO
METTDIIGYRLQVAFRVADRVGDLVELRSECVFFEPELPGSVVE